ncbi:MAG: hypothetical protein AAFX04_01015 [Pseudomonadota bacterium]
MKLTLPPIIMACLLLTACSAATDKDNVPGDTSDKRPYDGIAADAVIHLTGNEPFWGGEISSDKDAAPETLLYTTPDNPEGDRVTVKRFAGRGGLSFSGTLASERLTLVITPGQCSDTMSDRVYPFVVTLQLGDEIRSGCAWTDNQPFTGPEAP